MKNSSTLALICGLLATAAPAQQAPSLDAAQRTAIVEDIGKKLTEGYIYADKGARFAQQLAQQLAEGAYDSATNRGAFAGQLTHDLYAWSNDMHLRVMPTQSRPSPAGGRRRVMRRVPVGSGGEGGGEASWPGMPNLRQVNHGFQELRLLEGNIGYLDLRMFSPSPAALARMDAAMSFFDGVDGLIIDIGRNRGGAGTLVTYLSAYFFAERTQLVETFTRGMDEPAKRWTDEKVAGRVRPDLPVFLLTSSGTGSAAESFAFGLKINERVTIVGEGTAGAGHFGDSMKPLPHGFEMFLPIGRAYDPATGKGFEVDGVAPDVEVPYAKALKKAHALAKDEAEFFRSYREEQAAQKGPRKR